MKNSLYQKIAFLYPQEKEKVYQKLCQILDNFKKRFQKKLSGGKFCEKDIVLICYPDHVYSRNNYLKDDRIQDNSLKFLHRFLNKYAKGLINKIHLLPFYPYSSDEGFSVIDYYQVREELGDWDDIRALSNNFDLMFDFVLNHISSKSQWFKNFLAGDPKFSHYFLAFDKEIDTSSVYRPRTHPLLTPFQLTYSSEIKDKRLNYNCQPSPIDTKEKKLFLKYLWTTFSSDQIDLNYQNPEVFLEMVKVLLFYVSQGASMIRLDAVRYLWKRLGTSCVDLPETHLIIKIFRQILDQVASWVILLSEVKGSSDITYSYFGDGDESDLIYNFELSPLILASFLNENVQILSSFLKNLKPPPTQKNTYFNITATHDGVGLTPLVGLIGEREINQLIGIIKNRGGLVNYHLVGNQLKPYELTITYLDALGGVQPFLASQAIQLSLAGVPGIYFGSFVGGRNWIEGVKKTGENRAINREKFEYQKLVGELENKQSIRHQVYFGYKKLIQARINEPLFHPLVNQEIIDLHPKIFGVLRFLGTKKILCLVNISDKEIDIEGALIRKVLEKNSFFDLISEKKINVQANNVLRFSPYQVVWLK